MHNLAFMQVMTTPACFFLGFRPLLRFFQLSALLHFGFEQRLVPVRITERAFALGLHGLPSDASAGVCYGACMQPPSASSISAAGGRTLLRRRAYFRRGAGASMR